MSISVKQPRIEPILVLYGSQTGNSEQAAKDVCNQMTERLRPSELIRLTGCNETICNVQIEPLHIQLDDFIELRHCQWTRIFVIVVSSYGVGQAPLGSRRFRELCDAWLDEANDEYRTSQFMAGTYFAMCGLGDSKYRTFFNNPTAIDNGLRAVGSVRVGQLGKADASGTGNEEQDLVIERWINGIWKDLANVIVNQHPISNEELSKKQQATIELCEKINPDLAKVRQHKNSDATSTSWISAWNICLMVLAIGIILNSLIPFLVFEHHV